MKRRVFTAFVLCGCLLLGTLCSYQPAQATETENKLNDVKKQISALAQEQEAVAGQLSDVQNQIAELMAQINLLVTDMEIKASEIEQTQIDLDEAIATQEKQYEDMKVRIRYMYENGDSSVLQALLEAKSFAELLNRVRYENDVYEYDRELLTAYEENTKRIEELKASLESEMAEMEEMQAAYESQAAELNTVKNSLANSVADYGAQIAEAQELAEVYERKVAEEKAAAEAAAAEARRKAAQEAARKAAQSGSNSSNSGGSVTPSSNTGENTSNNVNGELNPGFSTGVNGNEVVALARNYLGNPYVWGGTDPENGTDCSGFTQYIMKQYGVSLYRTSGMQATQGQEVSYKYAQAGDLVFYAYSNGTVYHVGIYEGNGVIIHASSPTTGIIESSANYASIYCIRRVL